VAPAGNVKPAEIEEGIELLKGAGFRVKLGEHLFGKFRYFSGTVEQRVSDIHSFLSDLDIAAIYAVRGGSGSSQLLPHLNFEKWQQIKKILVGFSDITALQWPLWQISQTRSFSGMTFTMQLNQFNPYLRDFFNQIRGIKRHISTEDIRETELVYKNKSEVTGILVGGTLSIICSILGTPYFKPINRDIILYLEDLNEELYRIERMIVQLKLAGIFKRVKGLIFGDFMHNNKSLNVWPAVKDHIPLNIPIILNFPYGHTPHSYPLPFGIKTNLKFDPFLLEW
jgi:muramoyltetrapeptide carboxypeptidase